MHSIFRKRYKHLAMLMKSDPTPPSVGESYFATCERDDEGHCKPKGDGGEGSNVDVSVPKPKKLPEVGKFKWMGNKYTDAKYPKWGKKPLLNYDLPDEARMIDLTPEEASCLNWYTKGNYRVLNRSLREGKALAEYEKYHKQLQDAFVKTKRMKEPVTVYRGMNFSEQPQPSKLAEFVGSLRKALDEGSDIQLPGYTSTSTAKVPNGFNGNVSVEIEANKGIDVMPVSDVKEEAELLLNHNSNFKVLVVEEQTLGNGMKGYKIKLRQISE